jgi:hypothetical protein
MFKRMSVNSPLGRYRGHLTLRSYPSMRIRPSARLGAITSQEGGLLATGASVGTSVALASTIGAWAGPVGAAAGAIVGIISALFAASAARAKGAKEENQAINEYLPAWDQALQTIFQQANAGTITAAEAISALQTLMPQWWAAAAQFRGLPGVADASNGGGDCGTYTPQTSTPCTPTGGPGCDKSCTAFCCIGCHDLAPTVDYAAYLFSIPSAQIWAAGGVQLNVCTVYASKYGATQRNSYTLTWNPPKTAATVAGVANAVSGATGISSAASVAGIPVWALVLGGVALAAYELL